MNKANLDRGCPLLSAGSMGPLALCAKGCCQLWNAEAEDCALALMASGLARGAKELAAGGVALEAMAQALELLAKAAARGFSLAAKAIRGKSQPAEVPAKEFDPDGLRGLAARLKDK